MDGLQAAFPGGLAFEFGGVLDPGGTGLAINPVRVGNDPPIPGREPRCGYASKPTVPQLFRHGCHLPDATLGGQIVPQAWGTTPWQGAVRPHPGSSQPG